MRALVLNGDSGPAILRAGCKVPAGHNSADNYWREGNMLAAVVTDTGEIRRVVRGTRADAATRNPSRPERRLRSARGE